MRYSEMIAREKIRARHHGELPGGVKSLDLPRILANKGIWLIAGVLLLAFLSACSSTQYRDVKVPIATHGPVDLQRYQGLWYEIARFPNRFEEGCVGVTAEYSINPDGSVRVLNTCRQGTLDGPVEVAEGIATSVSPDNDRLEVTFVPWLPFAKGDYWILSLTQDYSVVTVGNPSGTTGWVLARTPTLSDDALAAAYDVLTANGYDTNQIYLTPQVEN